MQSADPNIAPRASWFVRHPMGGMIVCIVGVLAIPLGAGLSPMTCGMLGVMLDTASKVSALRARNDYEAIARDCLKLIRTIHPSDSDTLDPNDSRLTPRLRSLRANHIWCSEVNVHFEFQGGFDHCGVDFENDRDNPLNWKLYYYTEHSRELLATIRD